VVGSKVYVGPLNWYPAGGNNPASERSVPVIVTVTAVNTVEKYFVGSMATRVTLLSKTDLYKVSWSGCCRLPLLKDSNAGQSLALTAYHNPSQLSSPRTTGM
jgi:hypothetical protein